MKITKIAGVVAWILGTAGGLTGLYVFYQQWIRADSIVQVIEFRAEGELRVDTSQMPFPLQIAGTPELQAQRTAWLAGKTSVPHDRGILKLRYTNNSDHFNKLHSIIFWAKGGAQLPDWMPFSCSPQQYTKMVAPDDTLDYMCATTWLPATRNPEYSPDSLFSQGGPAQALINQVCLISVVVSSDLNPSSGHKKINFWKSNNSTKSC